MVNNQEDLTGLDCAVEADGYWNRQFTLGLYIHLRHNHFAGEHVMQ